jgi:mono/diheme cytochrome c family protein
VPRPLIYAVLIVIVLAMIPPALIARLRAVNSPHPRVHFIHDMDNQPRFRAQHANPLFMDGRAMRSQVPGTVGRREPHEEYRQDEHLDIGRADGAWVTTFPAQLSVDMAFLQRGRQRYGIYCQPCHGAAGYGDGMVHKRAMELMNRGVNGTTWVQPKSIHDADIRGQPVGQLYNSIANGVRNMPAYGPQIPVEDRWAIVAYVKALQRSQNAEPADARAAGRSESQTLTRGSGSR